MNSFRLVLFLVHIFISLGRRRKPSSEPIPIPKFDVFTLSNLLADAPTGATSKSKHLVIDCFEFVDEPVTFFRLSYLQEVVDLFILLEVKVDGKDYRFDQAELPLIQALEKRKKLVKMRIDPFPYDFKYRFNTTKADFFLFRMTQYHFRDTKLKHAGLLPLARYKYLVDSFFHEFKRKFAEQSFILIFSKHNEVPRKEIIQELPKLYGHPALKTGLRLEMPTFFYNFRWIVPEDRVRSTTIFQDSGLFERKSLIETLWYESERLPVIFRAGWRCSFCQTVEDILLHAPLQYPEYNIPEIINRDWLNQSIEHGQDIFKRRYVFITPYDGSEGYPSCKTCHSDVPGLSLLKIPQL